MKQGKWVSLLMTFVMTISLASCGAPSAQTTLPPETSAPVETGQPVEGNYPVTVQVYDENGTLYAETFEKAPERVVCNQPQAIQLPSALGIWETWIVRGLVEVLEMSMRSTGTSSRPCHSLQTMRVPPRKWFWMQSRIESSAGGRTSHSGYSRQCAGLERAGNRHLHRR